MRFEEVLRASTYGTIGQVRAMRDLEVLERRITHNLPVLRLFTGVVVATNYGVAATDGAARDGSASGDETVPAAARRELAAANAALWRRFFPECVLLDSPLDRGHSIGTADLDDLVFDHCKASGFRWLCKSTNDVLLDGPVLDIPVRPAGFYFLNTISYDAMAEQGFDLERIRAGLFFPLTNFYVIDVSRTDFLVDRELLDRSWRIVQRIPGYDGRIWEHIPGWSCERLLRTCALRNRLTRCHLMSDAQFARLLETIRDQAITDCSLKGLTINGICHAHDWTGDSAADGRPAAAASEVRV